MTAGDTVPDLVEAGVARRATATAVVAGGDSLSYAELDRQANRLAHHLQERGVGPDVLVGVCLGRSLDMAVSLLAVLKAGGACVPLDPSYPPERLDFMVGDAALGTVITSSGLAGRLPAGAARLIRVDADAASWAARPPTAPPRSIGADHLGYVIYTSWSTGQPKGVMLTHRGLVNHHRAAMALYELGPGDRVLQFCSIGFDVSIEEIFPTLSAGATVVFRSDETPILGRGWLDWLRRQRITVLNLPTAYWHEWTRDVDALGEPVPEDIRLVAVGGEKALGPAYRTWVLVSGGRPRWINAYGPTETTCMSTVYEPPRGGGVLGDERDPLIGRPLPGTTVEVVDERLNPVQPGVTGELLIGGAGLARGYLNHPELTAERFVVDSAAPAGPRRYRTGDFVRGLPSGDLEYIGRIDDQVKIRGFRIECGEVEAVLARHPGVAAAVVTARDDPPAERQLVAYVIGGGVTAPTVGDLRRFLVDRLPVHMVPSAFVVIDTFPLTPNGKVDRAELPAPGPAGTTTDAARVRPRSPAEERVAAIWARVLSLDPASVGAEDDFFALGGHSLLAPQVIAQIREEFGTETPLRAIFETPTVAGLATTVQAERAAPAAAPALTPVAREPGARLPLSLAQEQMWALEATTDTPGLYNITAIHRFDGPVDERALRAALAYLVDRHETLRTCFSVESGRPYQSVLPTVQVDLGVSDLGHEPAAERGSVLRRLTASEDARPFDLARAPLFRPHLFHLGGAASQLIVTFDHLICDGTAATLFMTELVAAFETACAGRRPDLPPLEIQFGDFALWQRAHLSYDILRRQLDWWAKTLAGMPLGPAVPFDRVPSTPTRRIASEAFTVDASTRRLLDEVARATGATVFIVAVAAVHALFGRYSGMTDIVVSTTSNGRTRAELEGVIGMFSGIGRVRTDLSGNPTFTEIVGRARESVLGMFDNQDIPFMQVRRALLPGFPTAGVELAAALPVEFQYFHTSHEPWDPANAGGERPRGDRHDQELFFRGQLHPLSLTLLDDGTEISGEFSYKLDFFDPGTVEALATDLVDLMEAVGRDPGMQLSQLPISRSPAPR
ncbi:hypothetical protein BH18ACT4_BH18ACT4_00550 [soil metagenome]